MFAPYPAKFGSFSLCNAIAVYLPNQSLFFSYQSPRELSN